MTPRLTISLVRGANRRPRALRAQKRPTVLADELLSDPSVQRRRRKSPTLETFTTLMDFDTLCSVHYSGYSLQAECKKL